MKGWEINPKKEKKTKQNFCSKPTLSWIFRGIVIKVVIEWVYTILSSVWDPHKSMQWDKGIKCVKVRLIVIIGEQCHFLHNLRLLI